jgi:hypothetical protein
MQVVYSDSTDTFLYLVALGLPVVEVAVVVYRGRKVIDQLHVFINHYPARIEESLLEHAPITDYYGTQMEHGISELELEEYGVSLSSARDKLDRFINMNYINYTLIVNDYHRYHLLGVPRLPTDWRPFLVGPRCGRCPAHKSTYFKRNGEEPLCALSLASTTYHYIESPLKRYDEETSYDPPSPPISQFDYCSSWSEEDEEEEKADRKEANEM